MTRELLNDLVTADNILLRKHYGGREEIGDFDAYFEERITASLARIMGWLDEYDDTAKTDA